MSLSKTLYPLLYNGSTKEDKSQLDLKIVDLEVKNQVKPTNKKPVKISQESKS